MNLLQARLQSRTAQRRRGRSLFPICLTLAFTCALTPQARGSFIGEYAVHQFTLTNSNADGSVATPDGGGSVILTGGNNGTGLEGSTDLTITAQTAGLIRFDYSYSALDVPGFDAAGYLLNGLFSQLADSDGQTGSVEFSVVPGQTFGFRVVTLDNTGEPGVFIVSNFTAPGGSDLPEPSSLSLVFAAALLFACGRGITRARLQRQAKAAALAAFAAAAFVSPLPAQTQVNYTGSNATGQVLLSRTVNARQQAQGFRLFARTLAPGVPEKQPKMPPKRLHPPIMKSARFSSLAFAAQTIQSLPINAKSGSTGFRGLTHFDQRQAADGNQFSIEPPSQSIAVASGFIVEGVNNAFQVYNTAGTPLLARTLSSNELFGLSPAIDRNTGINGVYPTDMRVFFDQTISRWFVLQQAQDNDIFGNLLNTSHLYIAVSQTSDPIGTYNIYTMDTTDTQRLGCPCLADFPQIGADQYGFYISTNEFNTGSQQFVGAAILALSKASLAAGASVPTAYKFSLPFTTGYEFAIQPATTPPGAGYFLANGGLQYFVSSLAPVAVGNYLAVWALYNSGSLNTSSPNLFLTQTTVSTLTYSFPDVATQRPGPLPYGSSLLPSGNLAYIDGGDKRVLSVSYAAGRLYVTLATQVTDERGASRVGGAYAVLSPTFRAGTLGAPVLRQGYIAAKNNHILRPAIAVNPQGRGAISFTLVGPDYYPTAAFLPIDTFSTAPAIQVADPGIFPEDGFTGYPGGFGTGVARWGDYSAAVATTDGSIWMATEYIPNAPRTDFANWGTFVFRYVP